MANKKIHELPVSQPIQGSEDIPVSQEGVTRRVSISDILSALGVPTPGPGNAGFPLISDGQNSSWRRLSAGNVTTIYEGVEIRVSDLLNLLTDAWSIALEAYPEDKTNLRVVFIGVSPPLNQAEGDLWWDVNDETLKRWDAANSQWKSREAGSGGGQGLDIYFSDTAPGNPSDHDLWWDTTDDTLKYWDDLGQVWVDHATPTPPPPAEINTITMGETAPGNPEVDDVWWDTFYEKLSRWDGTNWVELYIPTGGGQSSIHIAGTAPPTPDNGDVWWNTVDSKLYYWDDAAIMWVAHAVGSSGGTTIPVGPTPPGGPSNSDIWWDSSDGVLKYWDGSSWISHTVASSEQIEISASPPSSPTDFTLWWDVNDEVLKRWSSLETDWVGSLGAVQGFGISAIVPLTQTEYDLLSPPDSETLYLIV